MNDNPVGCAALHRVPLQAALRGPQPRPQRLAGGARPAQSPPQQVSACAQDRLTCTLTHQRTHTVFDGRGILYATCYTSKQGTPPIAWAGRLSVCQKTRSHKAHARNEHARTCKTAKQHALHVHTGMSKAQRSKARS